MREANEIGDFEKSTTLYNRTRGIFVAALGETSLEVGAIDAALANMAIGMGELDRAFGLAKSAREIYLRAGASATLMSSIETALGFPLTWHNPERKAACRLVIWQEADLHTEAQWPAYFEWLRQRLETMHSVLGPIVKNLRVEAAE